MDFLISFCRPNYLNVKNGEIVSKKQRRSIEIVKYVYCEIVKNCSILYTTV